MRREEWGDAFTRQGVLEISRSYRRGMKQSLPCPLRREHGPADSLAWTSDLENSVTTNFYCF